MTDDRDERILRLLEEIRDLQREAHAIATRRLRFVPAMIVIVLGLVMVVLYMMMRALS